MRGLREAVDNLRDKQKTITERKCTYILHFVEKRTGDCTDERLVLLDQETKPTKKEIREIEPIGFVLYGDPIECDIYQRHALPTGMLLRPDHGI